MSRFTPDIEERIAALPLSKKEVLEQELAEHSPDTHDAFVKMFLVYAEGTPDECVAAVQEQAKNAGLS